MHDMKNSPLNSLYPLSACWPHISADSNRNQPMSADFYSSLCADTADQAMLPSPTLQLQTHCGIANLCQQDRICIISAQHTQYYGCVYLQGTQILLV